MNPVTLVKAPGRPRRSRTSHIVFHTAAWPGDPSSKDIDRAHRAQGWSGIGYHYVIRKDGTVETGERETSKGAHCRDSGMNSKSIGVCFSGHHGDDYHGVRGEEWTEAQTASWLELASGLMREYGIPAKNVIGHREAGAKKACPGDRIDMAQVRADLAQYTAPVAPPAPEPVVVVVEPTPEPVVIEPIEPRGPVEVPPTSTPLATFFEMIRRAFGQS